MTSQDDSVLPVIAVWRWLTGSKQPCHKHILVIYEHLLARSCESIYSLALLPARLCCPLFFMFSSCLICLQYMKKYDLRQKRFYRRSNCPCFGERAVLFKRSTETLVFGFQTNACFGYSNIFFFFIKAVIFKTTCSGALQHYPSSLFGFLSCVLLLSLTLTALIHCEMQTWINSGFF